MHRAGGLAGPALTVKVPPGDNLMVHKAIALAQAGDIIVVDAGGDLTNAITGEMMLMQMTKRRIAGLIINGAIRDAGYIGNQDFPVFAAGLRTVGLIRTAQAKSMSRSLSTAWSLSRGTLSSEMMTGCFACRSIKPMEYSRRRLRSLKRSRGRLPTSSPTHTIHPG